MRALRDLGGTRAERVKRCENAKGHSRNIGLFRKKGKITTRKKAFANTDIKIANLNLTQKTPEIMTRVT